MPVPPHAVHVQILDRDGLALARGGRGELVDGVSPLVRDFLMHAGHARPLALAPTRPPPLPREPALLAREPCLRPREGARVLEDGAVRAGGDRVHAGVDAEHAPCGLGGGRRRAAGAAQDAEVLAGGHALHRGRQDAALGRAAHAGAHAAELRQPDVPPVLHLGCVGAVGHAPRALGLELREPGLAGAAEEVAIRAVEVAERLLERHGIDLGEPRGVAALPSGQLRDVGVDRRHLAAARVLVLSCGENPVPHVAAAAERPCQQLALPGARVYAVFERLLHAGVIPRDAERYSARRRAPYISMVETRDFTAFMIIENI